VTDPAQRLARWRVRLGYLLGLIALVFASPTPSSLLMGAAIGAIGEALRVWAAGHLEKGREVTRSGPYALTRHPLYAGSCIMGVGFAVASHSVISAIVVLVYLAVTIAAAVRSEEAHLTEKFGETYPAYREGRAEPADRAFSLARAWRNREYRALLGFAGVFAVLAVRMLIRI
jgi:protein-S-isoprenylcysteine O-methyltransferase Ste14